MYSIEGSERLFRVRKYELYRGHGRLVIDVFEFLAGSCCQAKFIAVPRLPSGVAIKGHIGLGTSSEEALNECLSLTAGLISDSLFVDLCRDDAFPVRKVFEETLN
jgi:hypothetical protein